MQIEVSIKYSVWPYEQSLAVAIPEEEFKNMDKWVDSITSNLKMSLLSHVRTHHPDIWYKYTPFEPQKWDDLKVPETAQPMYITPGYSYIGNGIVQKDPPEEIDQSILQVPHIK